MVHIFSTLCGNLQKFKMAFKVEKVEYQLLPYFDISTLYIDKQEIIGKMLELISIHIGPF